MGPFHQWSHTRGCGGPTPVPGRHPPAGLLHLTHLAGRGTIPPTDQAPSIRGRHGGGNRHRQPAPATTPDTASATKVLHEVTNYLQGNEPLMHNARSATMVHNRSQPPLRPGDPPMNPVSKATYLAVQQAATTNEVTLPPNLLRHLTQTLVIARIVALSTQALAYFLQAVLNAAIRFQALHLKHPQETLQEVAATVQRAWAIHGHRPTSLPAVVRAASPPYYGHKTDHLVRNAYTAHTATHLHRLVHNHALEVREVFTLTVREAQYQRNTCPQYILHQGGRPTTVGTRIWNQVQLLLPHHEECIATKKPSVQGDRSCGDPTHRCGWRTDQEHQHSGHGGHHPTPGTSHSESDAGPPTSRNTPCPLPAAPGVAEQISPGKSHVKRSHTNQSPRTDR